MALLALVLLAICLGEYLHRFDQGVWVIAEVVALAASVVAAAYGLGYNLGIGFLAAIVGLWWASAQNIASWRVPGMIASGIAAIAALIASPAVARQDPPLASWYESLGIPSLTHVPFDSFVLALVVVIAQVRPANSIVRAVLDNVGRGLLAQERRLKGGRVIGPLERVLVFGLAVSGNIGGVAVIMAAKGILRFPEINRDEGDGSGAEYVLVGSCVSWFIALALVPLF